MVPFKLKYRQLSTTYLQAKMKFLLVFAFGFIISTQLNAQKCPVSGKIEAVRMNILYIGVGNDIQFGITNTDNKSIRMTCTGCDSIVSSGNNATIWVSKLGQVVLKIMSEQLTYSQSFRAKYCPDPSIRLFNGRKSGNIEAESFKKQTGILPMLENFDFDMRCTISTFTLTRIRNSERKSSGNDGNSFTENSLDLIKSAQKEDIFTFSDIKGECTGDKNNRDWGSMVFFIE